MPPTKLRVTMPPFWNDPRISCRDVDPEVFYPVSYRNETAVSMAVSICDECPLKTACGVWAVKVGEPHGVWGGLTPEQRRTVRKYLGLSK
jgi:WhiB family redox-sensing transcriptional regulator